MEFNPDPRLDDREECHECHGECGFEDYETGTNEKIWIYCQSCKGTGWHLPNKQKVIFEEKD